MSADAQNQNRSPNPHKYPGVGQKPWYRETEGMKPLYLSVETVWVTEVRELQSVQISLEFTGFPEITRPRNALSDLPVCIEVSWFYVTIFRRNLLPTS